MFGTITTSSVYHIMLYVLTSDDNLLLTTKINDLTDTRRGGGLGEERRIWAFLSPGTIFAPAEREHGRQQKIREKQNAIKIM